MLVPSKQWKHFAAMVLIGDGVMAVVRPQRDAEAWAIGPKPWRSLMHKLYSCPVATRLVGSAQIVGGVLWALSQEKG